MNSEQFWVEKVEPLLDKQCLKCHAGVRQRGGLDLRSLETTLRGGDSGPAIMPGKPEESRILQYVAPKGEPHMPPDPKKQLSAEEIATLKSWIAQLPAPKSKLASATSTNVTWVPEYVADYKRSLDVHPAVPANLSASATIDWFLQLDWKRDNIEPARLCDDITFVRRVYLDIAGRIPTVEERKLFLTDARPDRRQRLVTGLIESEDYPRHMRETFDAVLMGRPGNNDIVRMRQGSGWNAFLEDTFRTNRPWNETVRSMLVARPAQGAGRGAVWFLAERKNSYQAIAEAVAPVVFGVQVKCAQCHNHPLSWEIEQRHYWGLVAAFNRSTNVDTDSGPAVSESAIGGFINFANLKKESQPATLVFLNGKSVPEKVPGADVKQVDSPDLYVVPPAKEGQKARIAAVPRFSRREAFADSVTHDNPALARAFVNRIWAALMGRGIVVPVDEIDSRHHPSHPELLEWMTHDFERSNYDIKRLVRNIALTHAYQLDSHPAGKTPPRPESFARALDKPLTAEQLLHSLWVATGNNVRTDTTAGAPVNANTAKGEARPSTDLENAFVMTFPDVMPDTYSPSLQQALFLSNSPVLNDLLKPAPGTTITRLITMKPTTVVKPVSNTKSTKPDKVGAKPDPNALLNAARVNDAFLTVLGRNPDATELQQCQSILKSQSPERGLRNLLWALLTCAEFQVNH